MSEEYVKCPNCGTSLCLKMEEKDPDDMTGDEMDTEMKKESKTKMKEYGR